MVLSSKNTPLLQKKSTASTTSSLSTSNSDDETDNDDSSSSITILGLGSLLSERSSRTTFPDLTNFRLGRVPRYRRVFGHPAAIFFQRGIANSETKEMSSLSAEYVDENYPGFVCSIFEVPNHDNQMMQSNGVPSEAFLAREEEFNIIQVPYYELDNKNEKGGMGILCTSSTDQAYLERWGKEHFESQFLQYGMDTIWGWPRDSGLRPCAVYLRHCYLAAKAMGDTCFDSFLDETYLVDRQTTIREYVKQHPEVIDTRPPPELEGRYSG